MKQLSRAIKTMLTVAVTVDLSAAVGSRCSVALTL